MIVTQIKPILVLVILSLLTAIGCSPNYSNSNTSAGNGNDPLSSVRSEVCGSMYEVRYNGEEVKSFLLSQPLPEMWIVEKKDNQNTEISCDETKIKLSEPARKLLQQHWVDRNEHNYSDGFLEHSSGQEGVKIDTLLMKSLTDTEKQLTETPVSDEYNARNITPKEAKSMVYMIRDWSYEVLKSVKDSKN